MQLATFRRKNDAGEGRNQWLRAVLLPRLPEPEPRIHRRTGREEDVPEV